MGDLGDFMKNVNLFENFKQELVLIYFLNFYQAVNIHELVYNYPWIVNDINLSESLDKTVTIFKINYSNFNNVLNFVNDIENESRVFSFEDLTDIFNSLKDNIENFDLLYQSMIDYILVNEQLIIDQDEMKERLNNYYQNDNNCLSMVKLNNKELNRIIEEERRLWL